MADKDFKVKQGLDLGTPLPISEGGTGQTTATNAINALLPAQVDNAGKYLTTDGTNTSWAIVSSTVNAGPVTAGIVFGQTDNLTPFKTSIGYNALASNTTGTDNVAIGYQALDANTTASNNIAIGSNSLGANTTGTGNIAVGTETLRSNVSGIRNTAVGRAALELATGSSNTALGFQAGDKVTTGANNVFIGNEAGTTGTNDVTTGSNNILIGFTVAASAANASNEITLGNTNIARFRIPGLDIDWNANIEMLTLAGAL